MDAPTQIQFRLSSTSKEYNKLKDPEYILMRVTKTKVMKENRRTLISILSPIAYSQNFNLRLTSFQALFLKLWTCEISLWQKSRPSMTSTKYSWHESAHFDSCLHLHGLSKSWKVWFWELLSRILSVFVCQERTHFISLHWLIRN